MEAQTLPKKKTISKGKIKRNIKNVLCRPDPTHWPQLSDEDSKTLEAELSKYKIDIPVFKKPQWKEIKDIEKAKRPKPPPIQKVEGILFGMTECLNAVRNGQSWAVIIEAMVNPHTIVHPIIDACVDSNTPVVCMVDLRKLSLQYFGITSSCLCIKSNHLPDMRNVILDISNNYQIKKVPQKQNEVEPMEIEVTKENNVIKEIEVTKENNVINDMKKECHHLYRSDKKSRAFVPSGAVLSDKRIFLGQNFISFAKNQDTTPKSGEFKKMAIKRIVGNPNRVKRKKN